MPVLPHGVSQRLTSGNRAGEDLQLAPAIIVEPFDAPSAGLHAIPKNLGGLRHNLTRIVLLLRPDRIRLASSPRLRALFQPLVLVDSMNHLRPKIPGRVVVLVDTLV
jgi:hypothetical protein